MQLLPCEFREISKNTYSYRAPPVATSDSRFERDLVLSWLNIAQKYLHFQYFMSLYFRDHE